MRGQSFFSAIKWAGALADRGVCGSSYKLGKASGPDTYQQNRMRMAAPVLSFVEFWRVVLYGVA